MQCPACQRLVDDTSTALPCCSDRTWRWRCTGCSVVSQGFAFAYGASIELQSARGARRIPLEQAYRDDGAAHLTIERDELLVRVHLNAPAAGTRSGYRKARVRGAMDFPLAGVAASLRLEGGVVAALRVALTGTNSHPLLLQGTEALLGRALDDDALAALSKLVHKQVSPMRSTVTAANHRRLVGAVTAQRLLRELAA